jgi:hypothetical protein
MPWLIIKENIDFYGNMSIVVEQLYHQYHELERSLNCIYDRIQTSPTLIERVHWKLCWMEVRNSCILQLTEKISAHMARNECNQLEQELLRLTLYRIDEGFVREASISEKGCNSFFPKTSRPQKEFNLI